MIAGKAVVVLQARLGSRRLPGKALMPLGHDTLLGHCLARLRVAGVGPVVLATTCLAEDDPLAAAGERYGTSVHRGETDDVLARVTAVAEALAAEFVIRATGDNPAVDLLSSLRLLEALRSGHGDHAVEDGLPYGCTVEAVRTTALRTAAARATMAPDREHVTPYIRRHTSSFRCLVLPAPRSVNRPDLRFTVDTRDDLTYMRRVFQAAGTGRGRPQPLETLIAAASHLRAIEEVA